MNVRSIPDGCFVREVKLGGQEISLDDFEISTSAQLEIVLNNTAGTITGSVSDDGGKPFPISSVTLIPLDGKSRPTRQSVDDDLWQDPEFRKKYENRAAEITVRSPRNTERTTPRDRGGGDAVTRARPDGDPPDREHRATAATWALYADTLRA